MERFEKELDLIRKYQCTGKARYGHRDTAERCLTNQLAKRQHPEKLIVYYCAFCNGWHIGNRMSGWRERQRERVMTLENLLRYDFTGPDAG